jgi:hypothetical protein
MNFMKLQQQLLVPNLVGHSAEILLENASSAKK